MKMIRTCTNLYAALSMALAWLAIPMTSIAADAVLHSRSGAWAGQAYTGQRPVAVTLLLTETSNKLAGKLHFGSPRNCELRIKQISRTEDLALFSADDSNGGSFCNALLTRQIAMQGAASEATATLSLGDQGDVSLMRAEQYAKLPIDATWERTSTDGPAIALTVSLDASRPGGDAGTWSYAGVRRCNLALEYAGSYGDSEYLAFRRSNGGLCNQFLDGYARLTVGDDGTLGYSLFSDGNGLLESGVLRRAGY
ncbi:hypothetical protein [Dyella tabacisoli]|uniref:META domain-containing protein n=1 Tax=Dyella tabacisoli TaxID=2282381 RepID=A0A369USD5_9GAMM|nr:hypothetical protein [Dyella tabacisoli]RDD83431.1 hypothetical protein DVJ77_02285 [Dyella tabacisoli]